MDSKQQTAHDSAARLKRVQIDLAAMPGMPYSIHACMHHGMQYQMILNFFHMVEKGEAEQHGFARDWHRRLSRSLVYENLMENEYFQRAESVASRMSPEQVQNVQSIIDALNVEARESYPILENSPNVLRDERLRQNHSLQSSERLVNAIYEEMAKGGSESQEMGFFDPLKPFDPAEEVMKSYLASTAHNNPDSGVNQQIQESIDLLFQDHKSMLVSSEDKRKLYQNFADLLENRVLQQAQKPNLDFAKMEEAKIPNEKVSELLKQLALGLPLPQQEQESRDPNGRFGDESIWTLMGTSQMVYFDLGTSQSRGTVENENTNRMIEEGIASNPYIIPVLPLKDPEKSRTPIQILHEKAFQGLNRKTLYVAYDQKQEQPYFCDSNGMAIDRSKLAEYKPEAGKPLFLEPCPSRAEVNEHGKDVLIDPSIPLGQRVGIRAEGTLNMAALELCPHLAVASRVTHRTRPGQVFEPRAQMEKDSLPVPMICAMMASSLLGGKTYLMKKAQDLRHPGKSEYRNWNHIRSLMVQKNKQKIHESTFDDKDILLGITDIGPGIPLNQQKTSVELKREAFKQKKANQILLAHQSRIEEIPDNLYHEKMGRSLLDLGLVIPPGTMDKENYENLALMMENLCSMVSQREEYRTGDWITIRINEKEFGGETGSKNFQECFRKKFGTGQQFANRVRFFPWNPANGQQIDAILLNPPSPAQDNENREEHFQIAKRLGDFLQRNPMPTLFLSSHSPVEPGKCAVYGTPEERRKICEGNQMISNMESGDRANSRWFSEPTCNPGGLVRWPRFADMNVMEYTDPEQYGNQRCCVTSPEAAIKAAEHIFEMLVTDQTQHIQYLKPVTRIECERQNKGDHNNHPPMDPNQAYGTQLGDIYMEQVARKEAQGNSNSGSGMER